VAPPSEARVSCGALSAERLALIQGRGQSPSLTKYSTSTTTCIYSLINNKCNLYYHVCALCLCLRLLRAVLCAPFRHVPG
jgi:hypothetical protein